MLISKGTYSTQIFPYGISCCTIDGETFMATTNSVSNSIDLFKLDPNGGDTNSLIAQGSTSLGFFKGAQLLSPQDITCCRLNNGRVYFFTTAVTDFDEVVLLYELKITANNGTLKRLGESVIPGFGQGISCCALDNGSMFVAISLINGAFTLLEIGSPAKPFIDRGTFTQVDNPQGAACNKSLDNRIFFCTANAGSNDVTLYQLDPSSVGSALIFKGRYAVGKLPQGITSCRLDDGTIFFIVTNTGSNDVSLLRLNPDGTDTDSLERLGDFAVGKKPQGVCCCRTPENQVFCLVTNVGSNNVTLFRLKNGSLIKDKNYPANIAPTGASCCNTLDDKLFFAVTNVGADNISLYEFGINVPPPPPLPPLPPEPRQETDTINTTGVFDWLVTYDNRKVKIKISEEESL